MTMEKVIVGLSGGVDSSIAALRLLEAGYEVEALFMKNWEEDDTQEYCSATVDLADAEAVADKLGIKLHTVNLSDTYWDSVFAHFLEEYKAGRTPNPDVLCNREIKFKAFLDHALTLGANRIATGHYADSHQLEDGSWQLLQARDSNKDQTYFLHLLNQHQLSHALFPLGDIDKSEVREIAKRHNLQTHDKKDSTGICFIGERRFRDFLSNYLPAKPGDIINEDGEVIGQHQGVFYYTIGQRQGLGIGGVRGSDESPWFVAEKRLESNQLVAVQGHDHPLLMSRSLIAQDAHWISGTLPDYPLTCMARCRHRQPLQVCRVVNNEDGLQVSFDQPQRAVTPGQSIVFYHERVCLGGAIITKASQT